ncbi:putative 60S ribosomal protein L7a [Neospora caninum Liverpool]|uniref:60S ribosomal protein L7a, putative n=1 Tax=Neospora caninum (strain Liverpool) TaxID=572307 RepID=F0VNG3_NEOCL|nr:putative 60S ribosomal protein L7a [Neospora caninum Liverpool]CBZ55259.1 putative 60S ribosomal protein L7a [Neospora caninum Liverpool]CEL69990.1 TPA: 60S ribosomal protein L7a, putative [Neospora caninum Liverpool]|eukprot:XP_003885287.1 putative 60S ribosomal protein L7a [Neospora caninum Liverpool]
MASEEGETAASQKMSYLSPIASPLLDGKSLRRSLKLIQLAADRERAARGGKQSKEAEGGKKPQGGKKGVKLLRRGVHEVTKCLRKGVKGIVFFASDVFPIEIIAHLPILCEEKDVVYAYLCSKKTLGHAFRSKRPASVIMITPGEEQPEADGEDSEEKFEEVYKKVAKLVRKSNPYF